MSIEAPMHSRRDLLSRAGKGFGTLALAGLFEREAAAAATGARPPHFAPKA